MDYLRRDLCQLKVGEITVVPAEEVTADKFDETDIKKAEVSIPGHPTYRTI